MIKSFINSLLKKAGINKFDYIWKGQECLCTLPATSYIIEWDTNVWLFLCQLQSLVLYVEFGISFSTYFSVKWISKLNLPLEWEIICWQKMVTPIYVDQCIVYIMHIYFSAGEHLNTVCLHHKDSFVLALIFLLSCLQRFTTSQVKRFTGLHWLLL